MNCRSLVPDVSGLRGLTSNPVFLGIVATTIIVQVLLVSFCGGLFKVEPLRWSDWLLIALGTSSVLVFAELIRFMRSSHDTREGTVA